MTRFDSYAATASYPEKGSVHKQLLVTFATLVLLAAAAGSAHAQTFSVVYNFGSQLNDPYSPFYSGIIAQGRDGNLYGTAPGGAINGAGAVFNLTSAGTLKVLYSFDASNGWYPYSGLTLGTDGNFYGTTVQGGASGDGIVFKITPGGTLTVLYNFTNGSDGAQPYAPPVQGIDGNFYGTTLGNLSTSFGTIYKITSAGTLTPLYKFDLTHGFAPNAPLVQGTNGNFYGTTEYGGPNEQGVVFKITTAGKLAVLHFFDNTHGEYPVSPLVQGSDGNFYGTATNGGTKGFGVVFKMTPSGGFTVLHNMNGTTDGYAPFAGLVQATDGNFYGANIYGGAASSGCPSGCGTIFKVTKTGVFSVLYNFDLTTGEFPYTTMLQHTNGILYGTAQSGGTGNVDPACGAGGSCGVVYSLTIGAAPFVSLISASAKVGKTVEILGQGFTGTTAVSFDGIAASFKVASDTYLTAAVPTGAKTGPVTVTTPGGTLTSNKTFRVTPQFTSFTPPSGVVGTPVTITGVSLTQTTKVTFGGVAATSFTVNSDTQVTATVPTGAKTGKIVITTTGGTATSATTFTVTP